MLTALGHAAHRESRQSSSTDAPRSGQSASSVTLFRGRRALTLPGKNSLADYRAGKQPGAPARAILCYDAAAGEATSESIRRE